MSAAPRLQGSPHSDDAVTFAYSWAVPSPTIAIGGKRLGRVHGSRMVTLRVYLVGDNAETNGHLTVRLERHAHIKVVATAMDEASALQWLAHWHNDADLVIVDLFLKAGSGLGLLRRSQRTPHGRQLVVLSNFVGSGLRHTCMALGAAQVFDKTTEIPSLLAYCQGLAANTTVH